MEVGFLTCFRRWHLFTFREKGRERETHQHERETSICCLSVLPQPRTELETFRFGTTPNPRSHPGQGWLDVSLKHYMC